MNATFSLGLLICIITLFLFVLLMAITTAIIVTLIQFYYNNIYMKKWEYTRNY